MSQAARNRKLAKELGAPDAQALVDTVPYLARLLSKKEVAQLQKVLDAAVVNPEYEKQFREAMKKSVRARSGGLVLRDRAKVRRAHRIRDKKVRVSKTDNYIRVDYRKMLTADALAPRTNNPDEAEYLVLVRQVLNSKGVWLRLEQPWGSRHRDPNVWEFSFWLGYRGDIIKTNDAKIDREELLGTTMLGSGYYRSVLTGPIQTKLKRAIDRFDTQYDNGWSLHVELMRNRHSAAPGVAKIADVLGGANFPNTAIWDRPHKLRMKAFNAAAAGDVIKAQVYLLVAAHAVEYNAQMLGDYLDRIIKGGNRAVTILKVAKTMGQIAEVALVLTGVGYGVKAIRAAGSKTISQEVRYEAAEQLAREYARKNGISMEELKMVRYVRQPKATILGNRRGGHSAGQGVGNHRYP